MRFYHVVLFFLAGLSLSAQPAKPGVIGPVRLMIYAEGPAEAFAGLSYMQEGKTIAAPISIGRRGRDFRYIGGQDFVLYLEVPGAQPGQVSRVEKVRTSLPQNAKEILLFLGAQGAQLGMTAVDFSPQRMPDGAVLVINSTGVPLALKFGKAQQIIASRQQVVMGPFPGDAKGSAFSYFVAAQVDGQWRTIHQAEWHVREKTRYVLFLRPEASGSASIQVTVVAVPVFAETNAARPSR